MASAEGDDGGTRVGPEVAGSGTEAVASDAPAPAAKPPTQLMPLVPTSGAPVGTNAEPLPMISPTSGAPIIRAVARRPATALPALGGNDGPRDAPLSARATADRRRQAAARGSARPAPSSPVDVALNPGGTIPKPRVSAEVGPPAPGPPAPAPPPPGPAAGASPDGWTTFGPPPRKPGLWRLPPPEPAPVPQASAFGKADGPVDANTGDLKPPRHADPEPVEVEPEPPSHPVAPPRHARPARVTFAEPAAGAVALVRPTALLPRIVDEPDGRALPPVLDADSWDEPPEPLPAEDYFSRRPARLPLRIWLVVGVVLLGLGAAAVIPQLFSPAKDRRAAAAPVIGPDSDGPPATVGGELIQPASAGGVVPTAARSAASAGPPATGVPVAPTSTTRPPPTTGSPPGGPFSLTLAAIDTHSYQSWQRQDGVCGGSVVLVGAWGAPAPPGSAPGTLTFSNITVPATGTYNLVITYAITIGGSRSATITLNGTGIATNGTFPSACTGTRTLSATFPQTSGNTIVFANTSSTAPSIMRIVISKP